MLFLIQVAWRNLWRQKRRSLITSIAMGVGVAMSMATVALQDGMYAQFFDVLVAQTLGHVQIHHPDYPGRQLMYDTVPQDILKDLHGEDIQAISGRVFGYGLIGHAEESVGVRIVGVDAAEEKRVTHMADKVRHGAWLDGQPGEVVLGEGLAKQLDAEVGTELVVMTQGADGSLGNALWTVQGIVRTGSAQIDRAGAYANRDDVQTLLVLEGQLHEVLVTAPSADDSASLARRLAAEHPDQLVRPWFEADPTTAELMALQDVGAGIMLIIIFAVASLGVLNTMLMAVFERTRELGVLRALGLKRRQLMGMILLESASLGVLAVSGGVLVGLVLDAALVVWGIDFSTGSGEGLTSMGVTLDPVIHGVVRVGPILFIAGLVLTVCVLSALWPALRAARLRPVDAMRQV